jgi:ActR/RegA family two-component response regulator
MPRSDPLATMTATALIVSPDSATQAEYTEHVGALGFRVHRAETLAQARDLLTDVRPDVLVTELRLKEHNGIHLAHLAHTVLPGLPVVVVGYRDKVLEAEAASAGATYVVTTDPGRVAAAAREAMIAKRPQRRWQRKQLDARVSGVLSGVDVRVVDVSYGGFRAEVRNADLSLLTRAFELHVPAFGIRAEADAVWTMTATASPAYVCGAAVSDEHQERGSSWRHFVDTLVGA